MKQSALEIVLVVASLVVAILGFFYMSHLVRKALRENSADLNNDEGDGDEDVVELERGVDATGGTVLAMDTAGDGATATGTGIVTLYRGIGGAGGAGVDGVSKSSYSSVRNVCDEDL